MTLLLTVTFPLAAVICTQLIHYINIEIHILKQWCDNTNL